MSKYVFAGEELWRSVEPYCLYENLLTGILKKYNALDWDKTLPPASEI